MSVYVDLEFLSRTLRIRYGDRVGAAVYIQTNGQNYIVTAAHVVAGLTDGDAIAVRHKRDWHRLTIEQCIRCEQGSDICVLRPQKPFGDGLVEKHLDAAILLGQEVVYCGFPLGLEQEGIPSDKGWPTPLIKSAMFSGAIEKDRRTEFLFDTVNNRGFSGGPIVKRDLHSGELKVVAIVSGYRFDTEIPVCQKDEKGALVETADYCVRPNSGFMVGIPIFYAINILTAMQ